MIQYHIFFLFFSLSVSMFSGFQLLIIRFFLLKAAQVYRVYLYFCILIFFAFFRRVERIPRRLPNNPPIPLPTTKFLQPSQKKLPDLGFPADICPKPTTDHTPTANIHAMNLCKTPPSTRPNQVTLGTCIFILKRVKAIKPKPLLERVKLQL